MILNGATMRYFLVAAFVALVFPASAQQRLVLPGGCGTASVAQGTMPATVNTAGMDCARPNVDTGAAITLTAAGAGTTNSADLLNASGRGVMCLYNQSAHTGTPSVTWSIQWKDGASAAYTTILTSAAVTTDTTSVLTVYPGAPVTANVSANSPIAKTFRVQVVVAGTTPGVTATVGCNVIN